MSNHRLKPDQLLGSREIHFADRQETTHPHLMRLCMDFEFRVLQLLLAPDPQGIASRPFVLISTHADDDHVAVTPGFNTLHQLENHVAHHQVDILHDYLFGFVDQETAHADGQH